MDEGKKIKILAWGDYCCATGFGQVMANIMRELDETGKYQIDVLGINYSGDPYDRDRWRGNIFPAMPGIMSQSAKYADVYGRQRLLDLMATNDYDVVFMLQDTFIVQPIINEMIKTQESLRSQNRKVFKTIYYFPIDAKPKPDWADVVAMTDFPVAYTNYGKNEILKYKPELADKIDVIYHGTNFDHFHYIEDREHVDTFKKSFWQGKVGNKFLIVNVNRNQPRKDTVRNLLVLNELIKRKRDVLMYLHMQFEDVGGNIFVMGEQLGLNTGDLARYVLPGPNIFNANQGLPLAVLNEIYNAADCIFTPTFGEGWGLSVTESMATRTPVVAPDHTSIREILADNRGKLVPAGNNPSMWMVKEGDLERIRPIMDVAKAADAIEEIMDGKLPDIEAAHKWVSQYSWHELCKRWIGIFDKAAASASVVPSQFLTRPERRRLEREKDKAVVL